MSDTPPGPRAAVGSRRRAPRALAVALALVLLAVGLVVSRPLPRWWNEALPFSPYPTPGSGVIGRAASDTFQLYYHFWLVRETVLGRARPLDDAYQFAASGPWSSIATSFLPLALPFALLSPFGTVAAFNLLVFLSFPACGLAGFALARHHGATGLGAAAVGAGYALSQVRLEPLFEGQIAGFAPAVAPLVFLGLDRALVHGRLSGAVLGGGAYIALAMMETHYAYFVGGLVLAYGAVRGLTPGPAAGWRARVAVLTFGGLVAAGVGWQWAVRQTLLTGSVVAGGRGLAEIRGASPGPEALLDWHTYGGRGLALLAIPGLLVARGDRAVRLFWGGVAALGAVLGLGPTLPALPLYEMAYSWVPFFRFIRNVPRFQFLTLLGLTVLAAYGVRAVGARLPPRWRPVAGLALLAAVVVDALPRHPITVMRVADHPVYARLRADARRVLYLPVFAGDSVAASAALYHPTRTRVPMLNGYSPLTPRGFESEVARPFRALNVGDPGEGEHARLRRLGVTHVVLDRAAPGVGPFPFAFTRTRLLGAGGLAFVEGADPLWLFRVTDHYAAPTASLPTSPVGLLIEAEQLARDTGVVAADGDASAGALVAARVGRDAPGRLIADAITFLPRGAYRLTLRARGGGGALEVWTEDGGRPLAARAWPHAPDWHDLSVEFVLVQAQAVRVVVSWTGRADAALDALRLIFADRPEPEWTFEAEVLDHWGEERVDPGASAGRAVLVTPAAHAGLAVVQGPTRHFPAGRYRLALRARLAAPGTGPLLSVSVTGPWGPVHASRTVEASELAPDAYREVELNFTLARGAVVDLPVDYLGTTGVYVDRLRVLADPAAALPSP